MGALLSLPIEQLDGENLNYPLGIKDYQELMAKPFNKTAYQKMKQYIFMGDLDENDPVKHNDCVTEEERRIIYKIYGDNNQTRWAKMVEIIKNLKLTNIHTYLIKGVAHSPQGKDSIINAYLNEIKNSNVQNVF